MAREKNINGLVKALDDKNDLAVRREAAFLLFLLHDVQSTNHILNFLGDPDPEVRSYIISTLGRIGEHAVVLLTDLVKNDDVGVQRDAATALGKIGSPRALEPLLKLCENKQWQVRKAAVHALGMMDDSRAKCSLMRALEDEVKDVRQEAAYILGFTVGEGVVKALITALEDEDEKVRSNAADSLSRICDEKAINALSRLKLWNLD